MYAEATNVGWAILSRGVFAPPSYGLASCTGCPWIVHFLPLYRYSAAAGRYAVLIYRRSKQTASNISWVEGERGCMVNRTFSTPCLPFQFPCNICWVYRTIPCGSRHVICIWQCLLGFPANTVCCAYVREYGRWQSFLVCCTCSSVSRNAVNLPVQNIGQQNC